jgi:hypothetical protein
MYLHYRGDGKAADFELKNTVKFNFLIEELWHSLGK